jgi:hypothetical protein
VDVVVVGHETNFAAVKQALLGGSDVTSTSKQQQQRPFYLLTEVRLAELLTAAFFHTFVGGGGLTLLSHNSRLDCHDCACLLDGGELLLSLTRASYERLPTTTAAAAALSFTSAEPSTNTNKGRKGKGGGEAKHDLRINLLDLHHHANSSSSTPLNGEELHKALHSMVFSFYAFVDEKEEDEADGGSGKRMREALKNYFGEERTLECAYRVDSRIINHRVATIDNIDLRSSGGGEVELALNWLECENRLGSLINNIDSSSSSYMLVGGAENEIK